MFFVVILSYFFLSILCPLAFAAHAGFSVYYPWGTRVKLAPERGGLRKFEPFCGDIIHNPQPFAGYTKTFLSFSGNAGDLGRLFALHGGQLKQHDLLTILCKVSVRYTTNRVPRKREDFTKLIVSNVPIAPSGQLCIDINLPEPRTRPEYGVLLFEAMDPISRQITSFCSDIKVKDTDIRGEDHPAMCARNNETLIPMPDEYL